MKQILFSLTALIFFSCNSSSIKPRIEESKEITVENPSDDDYKIINSTFIHLVDPAPEIEREFAYDNYLKSSRNIINENRNDIYFTQYLTSFSDKVTLSTKFKLSEEKLLELADSEFRSLGRKLISTKNKSIKLDTSMIQNIATYRLIPIEINQKVELEIGEKIITYSRIVYNQKKNKACFYFENDCSGQCGYAFFIFLEKTNGIWTIKDQLLDWIA